MNVARIDTVDLFFSVTALLWGSDTIIGEGMLLRLLSLFLASGLLASVASAEYRVATVDINRVINEAPESQGIRKALDSKALEAKKKVETKRNALKALEEKLKNAGVKEDSAEAEKFRTNAREYTRLVKDSEEELRREFAKSNKTLTLKALKAVESYAAQKKIDLVLDKSQDVRSLVLFGSAGSDITDEIIKQMR